MVGFDKRRRFPRVTFDSWIGVLFLGRYQVVSGHEIGEGGISFYYQTPFELAQKILLTVPNFKGGFYCIQAEVRNCQARSNAKYVVGVQFLSVSFEIKREIRSFVSTCR